MSGRIQSRIALLPKVELHLHLEGAIRYSTYCELAEAAGGPAEAPWKRPDFRFAGLPEFVSMARSALRPCLQTPDHYERLAYELFLDLARQNVLYVEVSFAPRRAARGLSFEDILGAVCRGRDRAVSEQFIGVGLIIGLGREHPLEFVQEMVEHAIAARDKGIVGIDLHGDEVAAHPADFAAAFQRARDAGLGLRAHAGEGAGADSVWGALRELGVKRIAHGTRATEDGELVEYLRTNPIALDMCPTSNYKLRVTPSLSQHPIRFLFDQGIRVTVNSDDPLFFNTNISEELSIIHTHLDFSLQEIGVLTQNAVEAAFISESRKDELRRRVREDFADV